MTPSQNQRITLHVCVTCRRADEPLEPREERSGAKMAQALATEIQKNPLAAQIDLRPVECLSGCKRGCTVAFAAPDKWTMVVGDLDPARHPQEILTFATQYLGSSDGLPVWRERPDVIRKGVIARVPPISSSFKEEQPLS